jgi:hypothetical protein
MKFMQHLLSALDEEIKNLKKKNLIKSNQLLIEA